jgi:peroxiredoxin
LEQISRRFREEGLSVVAVSIDDEDSRSLVPEFFRQYGGTFPVVWDEGHRIANLFRIATDPTFVLVDRRGVVRFVHHGYHGDEHLEMEREAATLLGER